MKLIILASFLCIFSISLWSQEDEDPIDIRLKECLADPEHYTTIGMIECYVQANEEWDAELNKYYKLLGALLSKEEKDKLLASQRLWLKFRDSENDFLTTTYINLGGTMWRIVASERRMDMVRTRTLELKRYYENLSGY